MAPKIISGEEFDRLFDEGSDEIDQYIDWSSARRIHQAEQVVATAEPLQVPADLMRRIDHAAGLANVSREALAARLLAEGLDRAA